MIGRQLCWLQPGDMQNVYSISKAAVVNMTKAFAKECAPLGIRVNALLPGTVLYLVSDAASCTKGECIVVDGGLTIYDGQTHEIR